jgi:hypothetical protein
MGEIHHDAGPGGVKAPSAGGSTPSLHHVDSRSNTYSVLYMDTLLDMRRPLKAIWVIAAAVGCAAVFGVGVPLFWVWVASHVETTVGQGVSMLGATLVILGPLASYIVLVVVVGRFGFSQRPDYQPQRMAWSRSRDEIRQRARHTTTFEEIILSAVLIVGVGFEIWYFFFASCPSAACFG